MKPNALIVVGSDGYNIINKVHILSTGDLTQRINTIQDDEIGEISRSIDVLTENMSGMIGKIKDLSQELVTVTKEISASAQTISDGAQQQSISFEQLASSVWKWEACLRL